MKITFAIGSRANYGSSRSVIERLRQEHQVHAVCYSTAILDRYGNVSAEVEKLCPVTRIATHVEGETPDSAAQSIALAGSLVGGFLSATRPDVVWCVGDRYEVGPVAYAAHVLGIKVAHSMGGEVSGTIDDKIRHSITQLATWHFVATEKAGLRVHAMLGEGPQRIHVVGCPRIDVAADVRDRMAVNDHGRKDYILVMFHPDVDHWQEAGAQMKAVLDGVDAAWDGDVHLFWPNSDPGAAAIVQAVRERKRPYITHRSLPDEEYYALLAGARCAVGNSSSFLREGAFLGTPAVIVGNRQAGRETRPDGNRFVDAMATEMPESCWRRMATCISEVLSDPRPEPSTLYGSGDAAERIAAVLREAT